MKKNEELNKWLWKWHFIAGLISLPFVLVLSVTGLIYLFKDDFEASKHKHITEVVAEGNPISFQEQWDLANKKAVKKPASMIIPISGNQATEFISGRFDEKTSFYVDPYQGKSSGEIISKNTDMFKVRKLHGELLMGNWGTKIVELIASWMIVLIITGLYVWWPAGKGKLRGFIIPRINNGKRTFFRDLHAVSGFWLSILLLIVLAGGLPWTDVFGSNFKWLQDATNTGYPSTWNGKQLCSGAIGKPLTLDQMVIIAKEQSLPGTVTIDFPKNPKGTFSVSNELFSDLQEQKMIHFDQYTGKQLLKQDWGDVGFLMRGRMWVMAFHQGQFGKWNWLLMIFIASVLTIMSVSAIVSYLLRKRKSWGVPKVPSKFKVGRYIVVIVSILAIVFPLFGISLIFIIIIEYFRKRKLSIH